MLSPFCKDLTLYTFENIIKHGENIIILFLLLLSGLLVLLSGGIEVEFIHLFANLSNVLKTGLALAILSNGIGSNHLRLKPLYDFSNGLSSGACNVMKLVGISRNTYYKYKKELKM